jgi:glutamate synthase (NADPH/NADH) large chain
MCSRRAQRASWRQPNWAHPDHDACGTGFLARLSGPPTHEVLQKALQALERLSHRGGVDADGASGDGAGLLISLPAAFFRARAAEQNIQLGEKFGVGMLFVPAARVADARAAMEEAIGREKMRLAGWRTFFVSKRNTFSTRNLSSRTNWNRWRSAASADCWKPI